MFRNKLILLSLALSCCVVSCQIDDQDIQSQLDDLNGKVDELNQNLDSLDQELAALQEAHQQALLVKLQEMDDAMADLIAENEKLSEQYGEIADSLDSIKEEVEGGNNSIYYGDLLTAENYASYKAQGASIVTGNVLVTSAEQVEALSTLRVIGGNLQISEVMDAQLLALETIGGDVVLSEVKGGVTFDNLFTIAGRLYDRDNGEHTSLVANKLAFVAEGVEIVNNILLETVSFESISYAQSLVIDSYWAEDPDYNNYGALTTVKINGLDVEGNLTIRFGGTGAVNIGNVGGKLSLEKTKFTDITVEGTTLGELEVIWNSELVNLSLDELTTVNGKLNIGNNAPAGGIGIGGGSSVASTGFSVFPSFEKLTTVLGDINVEGNSNITAIESFNNMINYSGENISFINNGTLSVMDVFNELLVAENRISQYQVTKTRIFISEKVSWFNGFSKLTEGGEISLTVNNPSEESGGIGISSVIKLEGFSAITEATNVSLYIGEVTELNAFNVLETLTPKYPNYTYFTLDMPKESTVSFCSLSMILNKIKNGDFDNPYNASVKASIRDLNEWGYYGEVDDRDAAIDELLSVCE
ncbi:hypothetical protein KMW28_20655 [Flammeovirga yaeyamensis]|uniref:Uncharacterized protein n=1 Tax=Flammeovirga yaeyamensis TaxID=367791 RepID=A0AAX1NEK4_9BACT|nr:hypothetical protein [Flammeovirga yaeyamensis]MBB3697245.1 outer membrane murein-binding lipoprotein Lpp [Flammeovirga yaeyamensis]NMF33903.1 hypothetical protein [Flammeovirga yaeyamensis]QWG04837.1 hypothetical protein KMW28_20655 [Flammeovirga yaeyamensis]